MFSADLLDKLQAEAASLGLKGATAISLAVRADLTERKAAGKVPDERTQTYWVAGRYVDAGNAYPVDGVAPAEGLAYLNELAAMVGQMHNWNTENWGGIVDSQLKAARVNLARKGEAHIQVPLSHSADNETLVTWIDLWVCNTEMHADVKAATLKAGKIF